MTRRLTPLRRFRYDIDAALSFLMVVCNTIIWTHNLRTFMGL